MTNDYSEAFELLKTDCENADEIQRRLLYEILEKNKDTEYGRKYGFSYIKSVSDFQKLVPLTDYGDYDEYIKRITDGGENILTADKPIFFCVSSGTTGEEKFFPLVEEDLRVQHTYAHKAVLGQVREYCADVSEKELFGNIFQIGEFAKTHMPDGRMKGIRSGCIYQWLEENGCFDASGYCVPKEVLFPDTPEDLLYVKVRFALARRDITAIHGVFINRVAGVMDYIRENMELLARDTELGTVDESVHLSPEWRGFVEERLKADPVRAAELRAIPEDKLSRGLIKKLWKNVRYILAIGGGAFSCGSEKMREYADGIPVHHYAYAASEGIFGIAEKIDVPDRYVLLPRSVFFEFIPVNGSSHRQLLAGEIKEGEKYELVLTNRSGLYRYRLGDVVEAVGRYKAAPIVKYCYRKNQIINIAGEKTNSEQLTLAVERFSVLTNTRIVGCCVTEDVSHTALRYLIFIECANNAVIKNADEIMEKCMRETNFEYRSCAEINEIAPLKTAFLKSGSFMKYEHSLCLSGRFMGQSKQPCFLDTKEKREFFAARVIEKEKP